MLISIASHDKMAGIFLFFVVMWLESCILIGWVAFFSKSGGHLQLNFLMVLLIFNRSMFKTSIWKEYHSSLNFDADFNLYILWPQKQSHVLK